MKNLIKKSLLVVAVLTTIVMSGKELKGKTNFTLIESKLVDVTLQNNDGELQVRIKDYQGEILYSEIFEGGYFSKKYDLKNLPVGAYYFEIEGQTKIKVMPFKVSTDTVGFESEIKTVYHKPIIRQEGNMVYISKAAVGTETMTLVLYDNMEDYILYKEEIKGKVNIGKKLNIEKLTAGRYKLIIYGQDKIFSQYIEKEK